VSDDLARQIREHVDALAASQRSPHTVAVLNGAADDYEAGGIVAELFAGLPAPPGSVPGLRLLAALHWLVLSGRAPDLAAYYPSARGTLPPAGLWPHAERALREHAAAVRERLPRTVQTNEPGRSTVLYGGLLWVSERFGRPLRLLEIGASGGLNLLADRYAYRVGGQVLGDAESPLRFDEPWEGVPVVDPAGAAARLHVVERMGCDPNPLDLGSPEDRLTLRSYVWADELHRLARADAALAVAEREPPVVSAQPAEAWLPSVLGGGEGTATVVWQSVMWQYLTAAAHAGIEDAIGAAGERGGPLAWLRMEPADDGRWGFSTAVTTWPGGETRELARSGDHGPPVRWAE
jgi:hypothetical protein